MMPAAQWRSHAVLSKCDVGIIEQHKQDAHRYIVAGSHYQRAGKINSSMPLPLQDITFMRGLSWGDGAQQLSMLHSPLSFSYRCCGRPRG